MTNYSFEHLSYIEFEALTQDLLQKKLNVNLERFAEGKDKGIDLRYSKGPDNLIIQCKKYKTFPSLLSNLKKEAKKVSLLKPSRYILVSAVGFSPDQKDRIKELFKPYVLDFEDIIGPAALNNLLDENKDIETRHFKLWLSSINILQRILNSKIYNQSGFELDVIKDNIKYYVENESINKALDIIKKEKYLIISGIPGIGKTTLARMLTYYLLANGYDEFIYLSDSINEGYTLYDDSKRQVFLFDDFLGTNFLEQTFAKNEEKRVVNFIDKIKKSKNKVLIMTTREYILNQAKSKFEVINKAHFDSAKYIIDLSKYTRPIRARILYNHVYFSNLPKTYIEDLLKDNRYLSIINHPNYSPRIIAATAEDDQWKTVKPEDFFTTFKHFLDFPDSIWEHAFEAQISPLSQSILLVLATIRTPIFLKDLSLAVEKLVEGTGAKYAERFSDSFFSVSVKELENTFLITHKDEHDQITVDYQNPSIFDFLKRYIKTHEDIIFDILKNAKFLNQFFDSFIYREKTEQNIIYISDENRINLDDRFYHVTLESLTKNMASFGRSNLIQARYKGSSTFHWNYLISSDYYKLDQILKGLDTNYSAELETFVIKKFKEIDIWNIVPDDQIHILNILRQLKDISSLDGSEIVEGFFRTMEGIDNIVRYTELRKFFPKEFSDFSNVPNVKKMIVETLEREVDNSESEDRDYLLSSIKDVMWVMNDLGVKATVDNLEDMISEDEQRRWDDFDDDMDHISTKEKEEKGEIIDMFDSLKEATK